MNQFSYRPGAWRVVVETGGMIAVPQDTDAERVALLHRMLRDGAPELTDVIDALAGGSIAALGSFAVALTSAGSVRFAVRGPVQARIVADDDEQIVSGAQVSTWSERFVADARGFEITVDDASDDTWYPISSGVVLAAALKHGQDATAEPSSRETPDAGHAPAVVAEPVLHAEPPVVKEPAAAAEPESAEAAETAAADHESAWTEADGDAPASEPETAEPETAHPETAEPETADAESDAVEDSPLAHTLIPADLTVVPGSDPGIPAVSPETPAGIPSADAPGAGDHDGSTISLAELRRLRSQADGAPDPQTAGPDAPTAVLPAVDVPAGSTRHGIARLSTGQVVDLDRTVIIGRRPRSTRASGENMPHLVAVDSPQQDISRSHLEIRPEADSVVVIDLRTTNGSTLLRPGADPVRLHPGEQTLVLSGDVVDLGDGVTVTFEGLA
ncbi:FHA domain-containing protein [Microbacterium sp. OR21]|uniref:FHA domain-containing protein n=1 Tax=Microbacterium sp. OR21 TaxID=3095346 RepID=UPI0039B5AA33